MCGIYGWIGEIENGSLETMAASLSHRGPDGSGSLEIENLHLGMNRLAIIDIAAKPQPYFNPAKTTASVCNGEIYNWREIRQLLELDGILFHTDCDAEIIPHAWDKWGPKMLERFNGMFAIAIWQQGKEGIFLARDRCGQKPLYYSKISSKVSGQAFAFASEPKALFSIGASATLNRSALPEYLALRYVCEPRTMFEGVSQVRSGACGWLTDQGFEETQWWTLPQAQNVQRSPAALEKTVREAVNDALESDQPIAVYLSSGVDSSTLLTMIKEAGIEVTAITAGFTGASDEVSAAAKLCEKLAVKHQVATCQAEDFLRLPEVVEQMQVPVGDALILAFDKLAQVTAAAGCKVALGGEGVDELFHGYSFLQQMEKVESIAPLGRTLASQALKFTPSFVLDKLSQFPASLGSSGKNKIQQWLAGYNQASDWQKGVGLRTLFSQREIDALQLEPKPFSPELEQLKQGSSLLDKHTAHQFKGWLQDWAIVRQDRNTMAHSVEYRMPFLDHRLINFAMQTPLELRRDKKIWRKMAKKFTDHVDHKTAKIPFYFPAESFIDNPQLWLMIEDCLNEKTVVQRGLFKFDTILKLKSEAKNGEFLPIKQVMSLVILELWIRSMIDANN